MRLSLWAFMVGTCLVGCIRQPSNAHAHTEKGMNTWDFCAQGSALHLHMAHHGFGIAVLDRGMDIEADVLLTR